TDDDALDRTLEIKRCALGIDCVLLGLELPYSGVGRCEVFLSRACVNERERAPRRRCLLPRNRRIRFGAHRTIDGYQLLRRARLAPGLAVTRSAVGDQALLELRSRHVYLFATRARAKQSQLQLGFDDQLGELSRSLIEHVVSKSCHDPAGVNAIAVADRDLGQ